MNRICLLSLLLCFSLALVPIENVHESDEDIIKMDDVTVTKLHLVYDMNGHLKRPMFCELASLEMISNDIHNRLQSPECKTKNARLVMYINGDPHLPWFAYSNGLNGKVADCPVPSNMTLYSCTNKNYIYSVCYYNTAKDSVIRKYRTICKLKGPLNNATTEWSPPKLIEESKINKPKDCPVPKNVTLYNCSNEHHVNSECSYDSGLHKHRTICKLLHNLTIDWLPPIIKEEPTTYNKGSIDDDDDNLILIVTVAVLGIVAIAVIACCCRKRNRKCQQQKSIAFVETEQAKDGVESTPLNPLPTGAARDEAGTDGEDETDLNDQTSVKEVVESNSAMGSKGSQSQSQSMISVDGSAMGRNGSQLSLRNPSLSDTRSSCPQLQNPSPNDTRSNSLQFSAGEDSGYDPSRSCQHDSGKKPPMAYSDMPAKQFGGDSYTSDRHQRQLALPTDPGDMVLRTSLLLPSMNRASLASNDDNAGRNACNTSVKILLDKPKKYLDHLSELTEVVDRKEDNTMKGLAKEIYKDIGFECIRGVDVFQHGPSYHGDDKPCIGLLRKMSEHGICIGVLIRYFKNKEQINHILEAHPGCDACQRVAKEKSGK